MKLRVLVFGFCMGVFLGSPLFSQTHTSVSLENQVYYILEQAETRGLSRPLSGIRPYTQSVIVTAVNDILNSENAGKLKGPERAILEQYLAKFAKPKTGMDWQRGAYYNETAIGKNDTVLSANAGISVDIEGSAGLYSSQNGYFGTEIWVQAFLNGDLGTHVSYELSGEGGLMKAPREYLGKYNTYYAGFDDNKEFVNERIDVFSEPLTHFPYSYQKRWDGSIYFFSSLSSFDYWPDSVAGGYNLKSELTGSFLENKLILRLGRLSHEWGSASLGSSLAFNQMARPFLGLETEFNPVSWFGIASLTGFLEYINLYGIKESSQSNQNMFSITMLQFKFKNYLFFDIVDAVVYPKRFELGYISPITNSFFYQNNIGDFDNMAMTFNLKAQYPGLGNIWFSLFMDEMNVLSKMFELDRTMIAGQAGLNIPLPLLAFSSLKLSYTKVNPYNYTHNRNYTPWYGDLRMETGYTNNGVSLGYYLPPNSDEVLVKFKTAPLSNLMTHLQYQLIRHGAHYGSSAVDGSHLLSELDPDGRDSKNVLKRYFLRDGAYQWSHIVRVGAEWNLPTLPISLFGEAGMIVSYFTDIEERANVTGKPHAFSIINTAEYPQSNGFVVKIGVTVFPH